MILTIRTERPEASLCLVDEQGGVAAAVEWQGHRELSKTILLKLQELLKSQGTLLNQLSGVVVFKGPGSFTGLRIGITIANTLAYSLGIPIVGAMGDSWQRDGARQIASGHNDTIVLPMYGAEANISTPKK